eukprot:8288-Heterococcus_DN1.PRE.1
MHDTCELDDLDLLTAPTVVLMRIIAEITEWTLLPMTCARPQESGVVHTLVPWSRYYGVKEGEGREYTVGLWKCYGRYCSVIDQHHCGEALCMHTLQCAKKAYAACSPMLHSFARTSVLHACLIAAIITLLRASWLSIALTNSHALTRHLHVPAVTATEISKLEAPAAAALSVYYHAAAGTNLICSCYIPSPAQWYYACTNVLATVGTQDDSVYSCADKMMSFYYMAGVWLTLAMGALSGMLVFVQHTAQVKSQQSPADYTTSTACLCNCCACAHVMRAGFCICAYQDTSKAN